MCITEIRSVTKIANQDNNHLGQATLVNSPDNNYASKTVFITLSKTIQMSIISDYQYLKKRQ